MIVGVEARSLSRNLTNIRSPIGNSKEQIKERHVRIRICRNASNRTLRLTYRIGRLTMYSLSKSDSR